MNKLFKSISLITLTLIFTLGLFGCGKKTISNVNSNINQNQNENVATSTDAKIGSIMKNEEEATTTKNFAKENDAENINTSNWSTYQNDKYGFEFKYPKGWGYVTSNVLSTLGFGSTFSGLSGEDSVLFDADVLVYPSFEEKYFYSERKQKIINEDKLITDNGLVFIVLDGFLSGQEEGTPLWRWRKYYYKKNNNYLCFSCLNQVYNIDQGNWSIKNSKIFCDNLVKTVVIKDVVLK